MRSLMNTKLLSYSNDLPVLFKQYFRKFNLVQFNYIKIFNDGSVIYICNNKDWLQNYLANNYPLIGAFEQKKELSSLKTVLWSGLSYNDPIMAESRDKYGFHNGMTITQKNEDSQEFFNFGSSEKDPFILNEFINNMYYFENFIKFFKDKYSKSISKASEHRLQFSNMVNYDVISCSLVNKKFFLGEKYNFAHLTSKEIECLKWLTFGKTALETAMILKCNSRTVETHLEHIKQKLNCTKQVTLGYLTAKLGIDSMWKEIL